MVRYGALTVNNGGSELLIFVGHVARRRDLHQAGTKTENN
jgi:hypothetical protein